MGKKMDEASPVPAQADDLPQITPTSTKKEMLDAYQAALKKLREKRETHLEPERAVQEKRARDVAKLADELSAEGVVQGIAQLKATVGKMLSGLSDQMEAEVAKYQRLQEAIGLKEKEVEEIYGIGSAAGTLAALIEAQSRQRAEFEAEMATRKEDLSREIEETRAQWDKERQEREDEEKLRRQIDDRNRTRQKEDYDYASKREQRLAQDKFADESQRLQKELAEKRSQAEKELAERERAVAARESELTELRARVAGIPQELEKAVAKAVKEAVERRQAEAKSREDLQQKEFDGERKAMATRIEGLDKAVAEQNVTVARLSQQLDAAYQKVQDIAVKAIEGSANLKALTEVQKLLGDRGRPQSQE